MLRLFLLQILSSQLATMRFELDSTFINKLNKHNLRWMRDRITRMWPHWVAAAKQFAAERSVRRPHQAKKVSTAPSCKISHVSLMNSYLTVQTSYLTAWALQPSLVPKTCLRLRYITD